MKPQTIGRAMGIGLRVAGRIVGQQIAGEPRVSTPRPVTATVVAESDNRAKVQTAARTAVQTSRGVKQGLGGFIRPFQRVGGILWLEVTGVFFLLFAIVFSWAIWQNWPGPTHPNGYKSVVISGVCIAVFLYLGVSSFWRASRR